MKLTRADWVARCLSAVLLVVALAQAAAVSAGVPTYQAWMGDRGFMELLVGLLPVVAASVAAWLAWLSYQSNQAIGLTNRYQKGVELLGARADSPKLGGVELLSKLALEAPSEFQKPIIRTLRQLLHDRSFAMVEGVYDKGDHPTQETAPRSGLVITTALGAICRTAATNRWQGLEYGEPQMRIRGVYLHKARILGADLSRLHLVDALFGEVHLFECILDDTIIECRSFSSLVFHKCRGKNCRIVFHDLSGDPILDFQRFVSVDNESPNLEGLLVNDQPHKRREPWPGIITTNGSD